MRLGLIGSGHIGGSLARLAVAAGIDVVLSNSRGPHTLADLAAELGPRATAATPAEAAAGDLVVVGIPLKHYRQVPAAALAGRTVLDTTNYYPERDGVIDALEDGTTTSSRLLQDHLAGARVVKAFNTIFYRHLLTLARPAGAPDRSALAVAGDDAAAKDEAAALIGALGFDTVDTGPLDEGRHLQPGTPVYGTLYRSDPAVPVTEDPGAPLSAAALREALAAARR